MSLLAFATSVVFALLLLLVTTAHANTEKVIFIAPSSITLPDATPGLDALNLDTITPIRSALRTALSVKFPAQEQPHGFDSWYLLQGLDEGRRYEVRVCWPAIQPTEFWVDVYSITHVFDTPNLIQSLAAYSGERQTRPSNAAEHQPASKKTRLLRVQAAADFFSTNKTLMRDPPLVNVDIILDPYLGNVFPVSLIPTAAYIIVLAIIAWFLSGRIWAYLAESSGIKAHAD